jgi:hypothetical protein
MDSKWIIEQETPDENDNPVWVTAQTWPGSLTAMTVYLMADDLAAYHRKRYRVRLQGDLATYDTGK